MASRRKVPVLLSGGNPQVAMADGDAPVRAYIAAMPGWKRTIGKQLDALVVRTVPPAGKDARWIDIHEDDLDEARVTRAAWTRRRTSPGPG